MSVKKALISLLELLKNAIYSPIVSIERAALVRGISLLLILVIALLIRISPYSFKGL